MAQGAEFSEAVSREDNLILLVVCNHHLGPVHHRCHKELQGVRTQRECVALLHGDSVLREILTLEELRQHLNGACRGNDLYCWVFVHNRSNTTRVVGLHMLHNKIVGCAVGQSRTEVCEPLVHLAIVGRIHNGNLLVLNKIRVIRDAVGNHILALKEVQIGIINTYINNVVCYHFLHNSSLWFIYANIQKTSII